MTWQEKAKELVEQPWWEWKEGMLAIPSFAANKPEQQWRIISIKKHQTKADGFILLLIDWLSSTSFSLVGSGYGK